MLNTGLKRVEMTEEERDEFFRELSSKICDLCHPSQIIVFGSYAIGDQRVSSDLDICLLFKTAEEIKSAKAAIYSKTSLMGIATDYLFMTEDYFDKRKDFGGVCVEIAEKGKTIYKKDAQ